MEEKAFSLKLQWNGSKSAFQKNVVSTIICLLLRLFDYLFRNVACAEGCTKVAAGYKIKETFTAPYQRRTQYTVHNSPPLAEVLNLTCARENMHLHHPEQQVRETSSTFTEKQNFPSKEGDKR